VKARQARLEVSVAPDLPLVPIDRHRILQVLLNLIGNSLKFGPPGGLVTLGVEQYDDANAIRVSVTDGGPGISPEQLPRVFDRFWRADRRASAGVGLAVAKGIVEAHGGEIGVTSQLGSGSTFFFSLPLHALANVAVDQTEHIVPRAEKHATPRHTSRRRVLLVDDDQHVAKSLMRLQHRTHDAIAIVGKGRQPCSNDRVGERSRPAPGDRRRVRLPPHEARER
jgi:hypothetical protein